MKKFIFMFFVALFAVLPMTLLTSCGDDDDVNASDIVGTWNLTGYHNWDIEDGVKTESTDLNDSDVIALTFESDGSGISYTRDSYQVRFSYSIVDDDKLMMNVDGESVTMNIEELNGKKLSISYHYDEYDEGRHYEGYEKLTFARAK